MPCSNGAAQPTFAWICQGFAIGLPVSLLGRQSPPGSVPEYPHSRSPTGQATAWMSCCGSTPSAAPGSKKWARLHHQDRPPGRAAQPGPLVPSNLQGQPDPADQGPSPAANHRDPAQEPDCRPDDHVVARPGGGPYNTARTIGKLGLAPVSSAVCPRTASAACRVPGARQMASSWACHRR